MNRILTKYELKYPNYFMFTNKIGSNLYYNSDKNVSSEKYSMSTDSDHATI